MREQDKPFILYRSGPWNFKIVPRGREGWRQMLIWMALMVPITGLFVWFAGQEPEGAILYGGLALYVVAMMVWGIGGTLWMRARAEVVDIEILLREMREAERKKRGGR